MMHMTFYWGKKATILVDSWRTDSWLTYLLSLAALLLASALYQYLEARRFRFKLLSISSPSSFQISVLAGRSIARVSDSALFVLNSAIGYLLMLAVMSFNGGVFLAVLIGLALGYYAFRSGAADDFVSLAKNRAPEKQFPFVENAF